MQVERLCGYSCSLVVQLELKQKRYSSTAGSQVLQEMSIEGKIVRDATRTFTVAGS
jgi:hypothetical protein